MSSLVQYWMGCLHPLLKIVLEVLHLFRWSTHTHIYIYIYLVYIYIQIQYTVLYTMHGSNGSWHTKICRYIPIHTVDRPNPVQYQLKGDSSHYLKCFADPRWCRILSINSMDLSFNMFPSIHRCYTLERERDIYICIHYHHNFYY